VPGTPISVTPGSEDVVGRLLHATAPVAVAVSDFDDLETVSSLASLVPTTDYRQGDGK